MPANPRVRANNVAGTITDNPLSSVATVMNSAGLANLPAISSQHSVLTLDPLRAAGAPEIVVVTAHTGSATSATITRGAYGSTARSHALGTLWVHAPLTDDFLAIVAASSDITDPYRGQLIYDRVLDKYQGRNQGDVWQDAVALGAWTTFSPTNTNITVGNGTQTAFWTRSGRTIVVRYKLLFGSTTSFGGSVAIGLPVSSVVSTMPGSARLLDSGTRHFLGVAVAGEGTAGADATKALLIHTESGNSGAVNATNPFTWTTGDSLDAAIVYEAAT